MTFSKTPVRAVIGTVALFIATSFAAAYGGEPATSQQASAPQLPGVTAPADPCGPGSRRAGPLGY